MPDTKRILEMVCKFYDVAVADFLKGRRGKINEARDVAIYFTRKLNLRRDTLKEIGEHFEICNDSTVSRVIERMKKKIAGDHKFAIRLNQLAESIVIS